MRTDARSLVDDLLAVNADAVKLCEHLTNSQLGWRPHPAKWSIAENLVHLRITTETFLPTVDRAMDESRRRNLLGSGAFELGRYGRLLVWYVEPPPAIRLPAPRRLLPTFVAKPERALEEFLASQNLMQERMGACRELDLTARRFPSPLASYVRMNLLEFFSVFNGHSRRHLWQAANVRRAMDAGS